MTWLPTFFVQQGLSIARSFNYSLVMALCVSADRAPRSGAFTADSWGRQTPPLSAHACSLSSSEAFYPFIQTPVILMVTGFALDRPHLRPLFALLFAIPTSPELFSNGNSLARVREFCNTFGRGAIISSRPLHRGRAFQIAWNWRRPGVYDWSSHRGNYGRPHALAWNRKSAASKRLRPTLQLLPSPPRCGIHDRAAHRLRRATFH